ncbi:unnamed protein product [Linum trigynum]|uniref:Uncharacterized protein n=1 Tax=Linum trigynum TaxID=586398 RepID=A0AAV2FEE0_9ROSI
MNRNTLVSPYYTEQAIQNSYDAALSPMPDEAYWPIYAGKLIISLLHLKRTKGRPRIERIHNEMDQVQRTRRGPKRCSKCRKPGHDKRRLSNTVNTLCLSMSAIRVAFIVA